MDFTLSSVKYEYPKNKFSFSPKNNGKDWQFSAKNEKYISQRSIKNSISYAISCPLTVCH